MGKEAPTSSYPYLSVVASSTHDMSTLAGWWKDLSRIEQDEYWTLIGASGSPPASDSSQNVSTAVTSKFVEQVATCVSSSLALSLSLLSLSVSSSHRCAPLSLVVNAATDVSIPTPPLQHSREHTHTRIVANQPLSDRKQLMQSPSMLAILPLQDLLDTCPSTASADPLNDQVNFPSDQVLCLSDASCRV